MMQDTVQTVLKGKGSPEIHSVPSLAPVLEAVHVMNRFNIGAVLVMENQRLVGIFTERDALRRVIENDLDPKTARVAEVMTRDVLCIKPTTTVQEAMNIMTHKRFRHLPVLENNQLLGMVSSGDLSRWIIKDQQSQMDSVIRGVRATWPV